MMAGGNGTGKELIELTKKEHNLVGGQIVGDRASAAIWSPLRACEP